MAKPQSSKSSAKQDNLEPHYDALYDAFLHLKSRDDVRRFMIDLCTPAEMLAFVERWRVAKLLNEEKHSYQDIHAKTGVSITTIGRVARFLVQESYGGYKLVLERLRKK